MSSAGTGPRSSEDQSARRYRAVYAELNARYQLQAMQLGEVTYLSEGERLACIENVEGQVQRPWDLWVEQARARRHR